jgi:hypothetical protein
MILSALLLAQAVFAFPEQSDIQLEHAHLAAKPRLIFFAPHENEKVVNSYLTQALQGRAASFYVLRQQGERELVLRFPSAEVAVDPNRIFTPAGASASLLKTNPQLNEGDPLFHLALQRCNALAGWLLHSMRLPDTRLVVAAIHNNTDGYDQDGRGGEGTISMLRYQQRHQAGARYIGKLALAANQDEDDLIFLTHAGDFRHFAKAGFNVVLQHRQVAWLPEEDDGSLSVWAAKSRHRYLNLEAQRKGVGSEDHLIQQQAMVNAVLRRFLRAK